MDFGAGKKKQQQRLNVRDLATMHGHATVALFFCKLFEIGKKSLRRFLHVLAVSAVTRSYLVQCSQCPEGVVGSKQGHGCRVVASPGDSDR